MRKQITMPTGPILKWDQPLLNMPMQIIANRVFCESINPSDLRYVSAAVLEVNDKCHELEERIKILELAIKELQTP